MSIIDLRFSTKSLQQLPHPTTGCQEYRDIHCPHLRALVYPNQITLAFRATINNQRIYETLGTFSLLDIEDARLNTMIRLGNKKRLAIQSRRIPSNRLSTSCGFLICSYIKKSTV
jgi:hypothetical protein